MPGSGPRVHMGVYPFVNLLALPDVEIVLGGLRLLRLPKYVHIDARSRALEIPANRSKTRTKTSVELVHWILNVERR